MRVRLVELAGVNPTWRVEVKRWFWFWVDAGFPDYDELRRAQEKYMQVVANRGPKIVVAETP